MSKEYFTDFRDYLDQLEKRGKLHRWTRAVNKDTELMPLMRLIVYAFQTGMMVLTAAVTLAQDYRHQG